MEIFKCKECGKCCRGFGGTYVKEKDIKRIAKYINEDPNTFVEKYCQPSGSKFVLAQKEDGYCVFWDKLCTIHPVKPKMCKAWPYIKPVLKDEKNWEIMATFCPGMKKGLPYSVIVEEVKKHLLD